MRIRYDFENVIQTGLIHCDQNKMSTGIDHAFGLDLSFTAQLGIISTATLASIGAAAVPSAGLIMLMFVLNSVGLNPMWIVIIYPIDRILDMCRTVINVSSDATVAAIVAKTEE